jgi:glyoxylase-like metal-dependent hydrolase (beta-lactamase superfamily II)
MADDAHTHDREPARWSFTPLRAGGFRLDGGSMFGLIPRGVWSRAVATDDKGRIAVAHNCLLLERRGAAPEGQPSRVLVEVGSGDKLDAKMREVFDFENNPPGHPRAGRPRTIVEALEERGASPETIDAVIVSHLHFDHAGGLTRLARAGETPAWPCPPNDDGGGGSSQTGGCVLTFPRATVHVQRREWEDAASNRSVMTKTYYPDHLWPVRERLRLIDSAPPFAPGITPERDELPRGGVEGRETDPFAGAGGRGAASGITVFRVPGHTWGQQAVRFREPDPPAGKGRTIVFCPDVMPTAAHAGAAYSLAYDVEPYTSMISRRWLLTEAAANGWCLYLDHEPGHPLVRVRANAKGWFDLAPEPY